MNWASKTEASSDRWCRQGHRTRVRSALPVLSEDSHQGVPDHGHWLRQIGPQQGSNFGGVFRDARTGEIWYVKTSPTQAHAQNEILAAKLYQAAGIDVPELRLITLDGRRAVASRFLDDLARADVHTLSKTRGVREGFAVDAWLANWDVCGAGFDNLLVRHGTGPTGEIGDTLADCLVVRKAHLAQIVSDSPNGASL